MIHLFVALPAEARPVIAAFNLERRVNCGTHSEYDGDGFRLVISGMGRRSAAAAVERILAAESCDPDRTWVNFGIGGHRDLEIGEPALAHTVLERATGLGWRLQRVLEGLGSPVTVCTVDRVEETYAQPYVFDMEASGICTALQRNGGSVLREPLQVLKIVSDNCRSPVFDLDRRRVEALIESGLPALGTLIGAISERR